LAAKIGILNQASLVWESCAGLDGPLELPVWFSFKKGGQCESGAASKPAPLPAHSPLIDLFEEGTDGGFVPPEVPSAGGFGGAAWAPA
jgi:hypothetical protein